MRSSLFVCTKQDWQSPTRTCQMDYEECHRAAKCIERQHRNGQRYCCDIIDNCE